MCEQQQPLRNNRVNTSTVEEFQNMLINIQNQIRNGNIYRFRVDILHPLLFKLFLFNTL